MADAEREDSARRHELEFLAAGVAHEHAAVIFHRGANGHFQRGPEAKLGAGRLLIRRAHDDVAAERILFEHKVERAVEPILRHRPSDERAFGQIAGDERLPHPADGAGSEHRLDAVEHGLQRQAGFFRDLDEWLADEALNLVLGDCEDLGIDGVGVLDRHGVPS